MSPDLRTGLMSFTCGGVWFDRAKDKKAAKAMTDYASILYKYGKGVYYNEPDANLENWKVHLWNILL